MEGVGSPIFEVFLMLLLSGLILVIFGFSAALDGLSHNQMDKLTGHTIRTKRIIYLMDNRLYRTGMKYFYLFLVMIMEMGYIFPVHIIKHTVEVMILYNIFLLVIGIYLPQKAAAARPVSWAYGFCSFNLLLFRLSVPFLWLMDHLTGFMISGFGIDPSAKSEDVTEEEIISMVREGHEQGIILASEAEMIHNIFEFSDKEAKDIMTRRKQILALDAQLTFEAGLGQIIESNYSRFPVYEGDIDNIIGVIHIKDALCFSRINEISQRKLMEIEGLVSATEYIPETRNINALFRTMQNKKIHLAVVIDEYGQTSGIVTMEDIIEEIVGNILDEHDVEEPLLIRESEGVYLISGMADFEDISRQLDLPAADEEYDTLNGYLIAKINKIPADDELMEITSDGYLFQILEIENKVILRVRAAKLTSDPVAIEDKSLSE